MHGDGDDRDPTWESSGDGIRRCSTTTGITGTIKKCVNGGAFYCNAAIAVHLVAKKNPSATSFKSNSSINAI